MSHAGPTGRRVRRVDGFPGFHPGLFSLATYGSHLRWGGRSREARTGTVRSHPSLEGREGSGTRPFYALTFLGFLSFFFAFRFPCGIARFFFR